MKYLIRWKSEDETRELRLSVFFFARNRNQINAYFCGLIMIYDKQAQRDGH